MDGFDGMHPSRSPATLLDDALAIWSAGVAAVDGRRLIVDNMQVRHHRLLFPEFDCDIDLRGFRRITVLGGGKACGAMADGVEAVFREIPGEISISGEVNIPQSDGLALPEAAPFNRNAGPDAGHDGKLPHAANLHDVRRLLQGFRQPSSLSSSVSTSRWVTITRSEVRAAGHNFATELAVARTREMLRRTLAMDQSDLCIVLLSGGGSALLAAPAAGVELEAQNQTIRFLSQAGATIEEMNCVRSALSEIKGGRWLRQCRAGLLITLIISDVVGDDLQTIASGPTFDNRLTDTQQCQRAWQVLEKLDPCGKQVPESIVRFLGKGSGESGARSGSMHSVPFARRPSFEKKISCPHFNFVIGNLAIAVDAAGVEAERRGYSHVMHVQAPQTAPSAEQVGRHFADMLIQMQHQSGPDCLITGGEPIVKLQSPRPTSRGGRNQQLAMAALEQWQNAQGSAVPTGGEDGIPQAVLLAGGSDGEDGTTPVAGACISAEVWRRMSELGLNVADFMKHNDGWEFFRQVGGHVHSGPTNTNVGDLRVGLVARVETAAGR